MQVSDIDIQINDINKQINDLDKIREELLSKLDELIEQKTFMNSVKKKAKRQQFKQFIKKLDDDNVDD